MKILNCILDNRFGGPHRRSCGVAQRLRNYDIETVFLFGQKTKEAVPIDGFEYFLMKHIQCVRRKNTIFNLLMFFCLLPYNILKIRKIIRSNAIDIVHVDGSMNIVPALAAAFNGTPIVWHYNDDMPALLKKVFRPLTAILADKIIIQGKKIGEQYLKHNTKFWNKMAFVYPGVDTNEFNADIFGSREKKRVRAEFDVPQGYYLVGTIGNINSFKGHSYFIKSAKKIKDEIKDVKFLIVGSKLDTASAYWNKLQELVSELGLEDDVIFTGFRSDIPEILSALDVFVLSSVREACPNVVLEAMAMRVPVVATDVGAVSEQVINGQTGILVQARNPTAIANAVLAYLRKPKEEIEEMLSKAQKRIDSTFSLSKITEQQKKIYEALLDSTKFE